MIELYVDATPEGRLLGIDYKRGNLFELELAGERITVVGARVNEWAMKHQSVGGTVSEVRRLLAIENRLENSWLADLCRCASANKEDGETP
jgi:hypothetical protein